jgi:purine-binding chemotaxis protein CheW
MAPADEWPDAGSGPRAVAWARDGVVAAARRDGEAPSPPAAQRVLSRRAAELARAPDAGAQGEQIEVLVFRLGDEQYAVELRLLQAVQRTEGLTPVPCTPPFVAGILNVRGAIVTVLDLAAALGLAAVAREEDEARVLLAELTPGRVGLLVGEVLGHRSLALAELQRPLSSREFVWGIAEARIAVLRLEDLVADGRFDVRDDVG